MKFWLVLLTLFSMGAACAAEPDSQTLTLAEAVRIAIEHHPDVGKAKAAADALKGKIREVRAQALPDVTLNSMGLRLRDPSMMNASGYDEFPPEFKAALKPRGVNLFDYRVTVKQPLFTAGKVGTALRLASVEAEGSLAEIDRAEQDIAMEVVRAWYGVMWAERYRELVAETQRQKELHADMARTRFDNGVATEVDVLRSLVAVANGKPDLVRAENAIRQARAQLNYYLARPIDSPTRVAGDFEEKPLETTDLTAMAEEALRRRPEVQRLRIAERSAGVQLQLANAENRMRADMTANYGLAARLPSNLVNPDFKRWDITVNFTLPLFDGFKRSGLVWQATAAQRAARLDREKMEQQVRLSLQQAFDDLAAARETVTAAQATIREADRVLAMTQSNYKYGAATTLDIVDAQTAVTVARTNLLKGLHDYSLARANLRWVMGERPWE